MEMLNAYAWYLITRTPGPQTTTYTMGPRRVDVYSKLTMIGPGRVLDACYLSQAYSPRASREVSGVSQSRIPMSAARLLPSVRCKTPVHPSFTGVNCDSFMYPCLNLQKASR